MKKLYNVLFLLVIFIFILFACAIIKSKDLGELGKPTDWLLIAFTALLALFTYQLRRSTDKLWKAGDQQIEVAKASANAAGRSAELAEVAIVNQARAWLDVGIDSETAALEWNDANGLGFRANFLVENKGNSPALDAIVGLHIVFPTSGSGLEWAEYIKNLVVTPDDMPFGNLIFSGETLIQNVGTSIGIEATRHQEQQLAQMSALSGGQFRFIAISVVVSVSYGIIGDKKRKYTTRIFSVRRPRHDPERGIIPVLPVFGENAEGNAMILQRDYGAEFAS